MPVLVKALGFYSHKAGPSGKQLTKLKSHLKYLEHGKRHEFKPQGFDGERDLVARKEFMARVQEQPTRGVIAHKLVFSLSQDERDRLGVDLKTLVRETMRAWELALGKALSWIGFQHEDKGHPHVHVVVAGYAGNKQLGVYERDLTRLRKYTERELSRQAELTRALPDRGREPTAREEVSRLYELVEPHRPRERSRGYERGR